MKRFASGFAVTIALASSFPGHPANAQVMTGPGPLPGGPEAVAKLTAQAILEQVGFDQKLGGSLPLEASFVDESGKSVRLGDYFGARPVVVAFVYFTCPMLCTQVETGLAASFMAIDFRPGRDFEVVLISIDPRDTPERAAQKKAATIARYGKPETSSGWHFLTGDAAAIRSVTEAAGFRYAFDEAVGQFAHAGGIVVATPGGTLARYLFGIEYAPKDVRLSLVEAGDGRIGGLAEKLLLLCFHYDARLGKYTAVTMLSLRAAALVTLAALGAFVGVMLRRERRARSAIAGGLA